MKIYLGIVSFVLVITACGGDSDSGIDKSKKLNMLSSSEVSTFCQWAISEQGGAGRQMMCGDLLIKVDTEAQCASRYGAIASASTCTATVSNAEDCVRALAGDLCAASGPACQFFFDCVAGASAFGGVSAVSRP